MSEHMLLPSRLSACCLRIEVGCWGYCPGRQLRYPGCPSMPVWNREGSWGKSWRVRLRAHPPQTWEDISHQSGFLIFVPTFTPLTEMLGLCLFKNSHRQAGPRGGGARMGGPVWGIWSWFWSPCSAVNNRKLICLDLFQPVLNYHKMGTKTTRIIETNNNTHTHIHTRPLLEALCPSVTSRQVSNKQLSRALCWHWCCE